MEITFNPRGNGACPICTRWDDCFVHANLKQTAAGLKTPNPTNMELVVYTCPFFMEAI